MERHRKNIKHENELLYAIKSSKIPIVQCILSKCRSEKTNTIPSESIDSNYQNDNGRMNSIHEAVIAGNIEILKLLIENGANVNLKDSKGLRPLHYAVWRGRTEPVFVLLRFGANVNEQTVYGDTPLHLASQYGHSDIIELLLFHHANPTILNFHSLTALDLACEHGHKNVVSVLLQNILCQQMLLNNNQEHNSPLHLSAKNGHTDIVRLLLLNGMDINRMTSDGTALHVSCRNGRYETAKLLLECGIDINLCNSYEQTAYEVVIKQKTGNDIKRLIKEFSDAIFVRAIQSYTDNHVGALNFIEGDCITVLDRNPTGQWRGFILQENLTSRTGYFPSAYVQLTPTILNGKESQSFHDSHSLIESDSISRLSQTDSGLITTSSWGSHSRRHSPTNSIYRHSAGSSIDSGRSSAALYDNPKTVALSSFMSSCENRSNGNNDIKLNDLDKIISDKSNNSNDIIFQWLREFAFENYAENFINNGYDMQTIVRMTPEDLTAIGITHPSHRRKIKHEINRLHISDGLPDFKPNTLYDWLCFIRLDEYYPLLIKQNYKTLSDIVNIVWEDLEEIGITRLGHQKRFMLGIKRLIDIDKGLYPSNRTLIERSNSLENNEFSQKMSIHSTIPNDSLTYATLRRPQLSAKSRTTSSFRLPPPLSTNRARSLENIQANQPTSITTYEPIKCSLTSYLSPSTESINGMPFANENIGTIKQRSPINHFNGFKDVEQSLDTMKRSLPMEYFQQITKPTTDTFSLFNADKHVAMLEMKIPEKQSKLNKNDRKNVLSDIDSMLSDLNRELDQMLDYETANLKRS